MAGTDEKGVKSLKDLLESTEDEGLKNFISTRSKRLKFEWFLFARYYLRAAELLLVTAEKKEKKWDENQIITSLFNLRHSLELVLKATQKFLDDDQIQEIHDIKKLFDSIREKIAPRSEKTAKQLAKELSMKEDDAEKYLQDNIDKLSNMVVKYYYQLPMANSLEKNSYYIEDVDNEIFRYPEAKKIKFTMFSEGIVKNFTASNINKIKEDINTITNALNILFLGLAVSEKE